MPSVLVLSKDNDHEKAGCANTIDNIDFKKLYEQRNLRIIIGNCDNRNSRRAGGRRSGWSGCVCWCSSICWRRSVRWRRSRSGILKDLSLIWSQVRVHYRSTGCDSISFCDRTQGFRICLTATLQKLDLAHTCRYRTNFQDNRQTGYAQYGLTWHLWKIR
jgi:hypothetical protein